jgi:hypothetical protein
MSLRSVVISTIIFLLVVLNPATAGASQQVELTASFSPDRLGASTTIHFGFTISSLTGRVPSPVTDVQISLPAGMGLGTTDLGEETCNPTMLLEFGPEGCSPNSRMGVGNATVEIPVEFAESPKFHASVTIYMGVPQHQHTTMLIYAETKTPVSGEYLFPSELLPTSGIYGAELHTAMPLIPTWPDGPPAAVIHMETTLGPSHLTYFTHRHGKLVPYAPEGMAVPERCPHGGFPFRGTYHFDDGSTVSATARVPCPRTAEPRARRGRPRHLAPGARHRR